MVDSFDPLEKRVETMMTIIDATITSSSGSPENQLLLACAMLQRTKEIMDIVIGVEGRKEMFKEFI